MKNLFTILLGFFSLVSISEAQFTLTSADITSFYGSKRVSNTDTLTKGINIGVTGGGNTWDLSSLASHTATTSESIAPASAPNISDYPTANFVLKSQMPSMGGTLADFYSYVIITENSFMVLGGEMAFVWQTMQLKMNLANAPGNKTLIFPYTYNTQWADNFSYTASTTMSGVPLNSYTETHTINYKVDAYGTVKMPGGAVTPALRIKTDDRYILTSDNSSHQKVSYEIITQAGFRASIHAADALAADNGVIAIETVSWMSGGTVGVEQESKIPANYSLNQNYPNPFNPVSTIEFQIPKSGFATLKVYDALGKEVAVLFNGSISAGTHKVLFNGSELNSGIYFYRLQTADFTQTRKAILIK